MQSHERIPGCSIYRAGDGVHATWLELRDKPLDRLAWYLFAGAEARAVAHDIFLDGNTFDSKQSIGKRPLVADVQAGLAIVFRQTRISYTQVWRTKEFDGQKKPDYFGSISITSKF